MSEFLWLHDYLDDQVVGYEAVPPYGGPTFSGEAVLVRRSPEALLSWIERHGPTDPVVAVEVTYGIIRNTFLSSGVAFVMDEGSLQNFDRYSEEDTRYNFNIRRVVNDHGVVIEPEFVAWRDSSVELNDQIQHAVLGYRVAINNGLYFQNYQGSDVVFGSLLDCRRFCIRTGGNGNPEPIEYRVYRSLEASGSRFSLDENAHERLFEIEEWDERIESRRREEAASAPTEIVASVVNDDCSLDSPQDPAGLASSVLIDPWALALARMMAYLEEPDILEMPGWLGGYLISRREPGAPNEREPRGRSPEKSVLSD